MVCSKAPLSLHHVELHVSHLRRCGVEVVGEQLSKLVVGHGLYTPCIYHIGQHPARDVSDVSGLLAVVLGG
jgi:hypothetical protein